MGRDLEAILNECLTRIEQGGSCEACMAQYPGLAADLEPLLVLALECKTLSQDREPSSPALLAGRQRLLREAARMRRSLDASRAASPALRWSFQALLRRSMAAITMVALLLVGALGGTTIAVSAKSLPGDTLYPVKRMAEDLRILVTLDGKAKVQLAQEFDARRRAEALAMATSQRVAEMSFRGRVESRNGARWTIGGVPVQTSGETVLEGDVQEGALVRASIRSLSDGTLLAVGISVEPEQPAPQPIVYPTLTPEPTLTPVPSVVPPTATPVQTPVPTATSSPTPTPRPTATLTPTAIPATSTPPRQTKVRFTGRIEAIASGAWTIGGQVARIDSHTVIDERQERAAIGASVVVLAVQMDDGSLLALEITVERAPEVPAQPFEFQGIIESFGPAQWVVGGHVLQISADTRVEGSPQQGLLAEVKAMRQGDGSLHATRIIVRPPSEEVQFEGQIQAWASGEWTVDGVTVRIDAQTVIVGTPAMGLTAEVQGLLLPDGAVLARMISVQPPPGSSASAPPSVRADVWEGECS